MYNITKIRTKAYLKKYVCILLFVRLMCYTGTQLEIKRKAAHLLVTSEPLRNTKTPNRNLGVIEMAFNYASYADKQARANRRDARHVELDAFGNVLNTDKNGEEFWEVHRT